MERAPHGHPEHQEDLGTGSGRKGKGEPMKSPSFAENTQKRERQIASTQPPGMSAGEKGGCGAEKSGLEGRWGKKEG